MRTSSGHRFPARWSVLPRKDRLARDENEADQHWGDWEQMNLATGNARW